MNGLPFQDLGRRLKIFKPAIAGRPKKDLVNLNLSDLIDRFRIVDLMRTGDHRFEIFRIDSYGLFINGIAVRRHLFEIAGSSHAAQPIPCDFIGGEKSHLRPCFHRHIGDGYPARHLEVFNRISYEF
jgi:hypothetical protein